MKRGSNSAPFFKPVTEEQIFDEMIEFGLSLNVAVKVAGPYARLFNAAEGKRERVVDLAPRLAARLGWVRIQ